MPGGAGRPRRGPGRGARSACWTGAAPPPARFIGISQDARAEEPEGEKKSPVVTVAE